MTGWCPYIDGTLKEAECHHDGYCSDCPYKKDDDKKEALIFDFGSFILGMEFMLIIIAIALGYD